ncbi:MAG: hypothetical protein AB1489_37475 [Acidobacteriota bacterium]
MCAILFVISCGDSVRQYYAMVDVKGMLVWFYGQYTYGAGV